MELAGSFWGGMRYWFGGGIDLRHSAGMNAPILSPVSGKVIAAKDGWPERRRATPLDILGALSAGLRLSEAKLRADYRCVAGNYLIVEGREGFAFLAHATTGSIRVSEGDTGHRANLLPKWATPATPRRRTCISTSWMALTSGLQKVCRAASSHMTIS